MIDFLSWDSGGIPALMFFMWYFFLNDYKNKEKRKMNAYISMLSILIILIILAVYLWIII